MIYFITKQIYVFESSFVEVKNDFEKLSKWLKDKDVLFCDTETTGVDYHSDKLLLIQIGDKDTQFVIDSRELTENEKEFLKEEVFESGKRIVFHNAVFDYNMLKQIKILCKNIYDTMLGEKVVMRGIYSPDEIRRTSPFSLASLCVKYLNISLSKEERTSFINHKGEFKLSQIEYAANDCKYLDLLYQKVSEEVKKKDLETDLSLQNRYALAAGDMLYNGVYLNSEKWYNLYKNNLVLLKSMERELDSQLMEEKEEIWKNYKDIQLELFTSDKRDLTINYNSNKQVKELLQKLGFGFKDKHNKETVSIKELEKIIGENAFIDKYIEYKKLDKLISSFGLKWLNEINTTTNRIHFSLDQVLATGRTASFRPNLYQVPQDERYRSCFEGQNENKIVGADYANQEGRIMADKAKDSAYIDFFNNGDGDSHSFVATKMFSAAFGREFIVTKDNENSAYRQKGKILNFFVSFGGSDYTLSLTLGIPREEAKELIDAFFAAFPTLKKMFDEEKEFALEHGYSVSNLVTKGKRFFPNWKEWKHLTEEIADLRSKVGDEMFFEMLKAEKIAFNKMKEQNPEGFIYEFKKRRNGQFYLNNKKAYKLKGDMEREAMNNPIQSTAADMTKTACIILRNKLIEIGQLPFASADIKLILMPHDEIQLEATTKYSELAAKLLEDSMEEAGKIFAPSVNLRPDAEINTCWKK